jgi:hypothetical protein
VQKVIEDRANKPYQLKSQDCVSFTKAVAKSLKLELPDRAWFNNFPTNYIEELSMTNLEKLDTRADKTEREEKQPTKSQPPIAGPH